MKNSNSNVRAFGAAGNVHLLLLAVVIGLTGSAFAQQEKSSATVQVLSTKNLQRVSPGPAPIYVPPPVFDVAQGGARAVPKGREPIVQPIEGPAPERSPAPARAQTSSGSALLDALLGMLGAK